MPKKSKRHYLDDISANKPARKTASANKSKGSLKTNATKLSVIQPNTPSNNASPAPKNSSCAPPTKKSNNAPSS